MTAMLLEDEIQSLLNQTETLAASAEETSRMKLLAPLAALVAEVEGALSMTPSKAKEQASAIAEWRNASQTLANLEEASDSARVEHGMEQTTSPIKATLFSASAKESSKEEKTNTAAPAA